MMIRQDGENSVDKKALQINLDATKYGTFAEIGAGQEVARQFFHVGGASGTIAKTISAYDMTFSDAIYGPTPRYVSRQRLYQMLEYEYKLLIERLADKRGGKTSFFAFANTVAARAYNHPSESHGWLGIRWQAHPRAEPNQIIIHVRMLDKENLQQQEALGIIGVNLIHGAFYQYQNPGDPHRRAAPQSGHRTHPGGHDQVHRAGFPLHRQPAHGAPIGRAGAVGRRDVHRRRRGRARGRALLYKKDGASSSAAASGR